MTAVMPPPTVKTTTELRLERGPRDCDHRFVIACPWPKKGENLGTLLRTADAVGACLVVGGPERGAMRALQKGNTTGLEHVCWRHHSNPATIGRQLPRPWFVVELAHHSTALADLPPSAHGSIILGHEVTGVPQGFVDAAEYVVEIPMQGVANSLNVAVAGSLVAYKVRGWA